MSRARRLAVVAAAGVIAEVVVAFVAPSAHARDLVVLGMAFVAAELFELVPASRAPLPLSFAVAVVFVRAATTREFAISIAAATLLAIGLRPDPRRVLARVLLLLERLLEVAAIGAAYRVVLHSATHEDTRAAVLSALAAAAVAGVLVSDLFTLVRTRRIAHLGARGADIALVTSGMLMAVGYSGINGEGRLGLWGPLLFAIPLLAAWYSFELLAATRRNLRQTARALGAAAELGGYVREGHVARVADLAVAMGSDLGLSFAELEDLETAAVLHHLGAVCLDEPAEGTSHDPVEVARSGATMLRASEALVPAGDIVAAEHSLYRPPGGQDSPAAPLAGQILKVASAFDDLTEGDPSHAEWAVEALFTGPAYVYDGRVLTALDAVLARRGVLTATR
jgi:hypothetical protein